MTKDERNMLEVELSELKARNARWHKPGNGNGALASIQGFKLWVLTGLTAALTPALVYFLMNWIGGVNAHMATALLGFERLAKVEAAGEANTRSIADLTEQFKESRKDQLEFYRFVYLRMWDQGRATEARKSLLKIKPSPSPAPRP